MNTLLRISTSFLLILLAICTSLAQDFNENDDRDKIMAQLRPYKHNFIAKDLKLSKEQQREFIPLYDSMDEELQKVNDETRKLERSVTEKKDATETELNAASRAIFEQKSKEAEIELAYYEKFKDVLTPEQLLKLKGSERRFTKWIMKHHRRMSRERIGAAD